MKRPFLVLGREYEVLLDQQLAAKADLEAERAKSAMLREEIHAGELTVVQLRGEVAEVRARLELMEKAVVALEAERDRLLDLVETMEVNLGVDARNPANQPKEKPQTVSVTGSDVVRRAEEFRAAHPQPKPWRSVPSRAAREAAAAAGGQK